MRSRLFKLHLAIIKLLQPFRGSPQLFQDLEFVILISKDHTYLNRKPSADQEQPQSALRVFSEN